jgi:hypothetical protein
MEGGTEMIKMQIALPENVMDAIRAEAALFGVTPNILARQRLCEMFLGFKSDVSEKAYVMRLKNWKEVESYVKVKYLNAKVEDFALKAIFSEMKKHGLKSTQKDEFDRLLGE